MRFTAPRGTRPAVPFRMLTERASFLKAATARRAPVETLVLQGRDRRDGEAVVGVGFTCSKKVGNAVARNRAKRRLREAARHVLPALARPGWDYVLIGRRDATAARDWPALLSDLHGAVERVHR